MDYVITEDGSPTCFDPQTNELYHNRAGAYTEALENYILPCCLEPYFLENEQISVLDICFGLGYNTFVLIQALLKASVELQKNIQANILAVDLNQEILSTLVVVLSDQRFADLEGVKHIFDDFLKMGYLERLSEEFNIEHVLENERHFLYCSKGRLKYEFKIAAVEGIVEFRFEDLRKAIPELCGDFDFVFHDGFSPYKIPELWTVDLFRQYYRLLANRRGDFVTYSASPAVRGGLLEAGFSIYRTVSLGRKNGGTLAKVQDKGAVECAYYGTLKIDEMLKLKTRSAIPFRDPEFNLQRGEIQCRRKQEQNDFSISSDK